jgi:WD40 repeat protein
LSIGGGDKQKKNKTDGGTTVISLNYSEALNYVAFGGSKGQIGVLDATTLTFKGLYEGENAHEDKVESLYFYDEELLLITVARDSEVILWDAQKMVILHRVKMGSKNIGGYSHINTNTFYPKMGMLLMCT